MKTRNFSISMIVLLIFSAGCIGPKGFKPDQKREFVLNMKDDALSQLYREKPHTQKLIENAAGYGVFSNINTQILFVGGGGGYGLITDNQNGTQTYMKMGEVGLALGVGIKDFREIIIFNSPGVLYKFINFGWDLTLAGDAAAKSGSKGGAIGTETDFQSDIVIYQITKNGIALSTSLVGSKYWKDKELNY
jgi:lipid-binding SYLF domain-containing protein